MNQKLKISISNTATLGIAKLIFSTSYTGKVLITGKRDGNSVISFSKLMLANDLDTFDFSGSCSLNGICLVDEVEFALADDKSKGKNWCGRGNGRHKIYGNYHDDDDSDDELRYGLSS